MYASGFRFYFTPLTAVLFAFPSRYWFTIGRQRVFSLGGWSPHVQTRFHVPRPTQFSCVWPFEYGAITRYGRTFQTVLLGFTHFWATPRSLATTSGISVDFCSSRYLDVSVPWVCFQQLCIHCRIRLESRGLPHSEILGSKLVCQLPEAYRRLQRPSSPVAAKAST